jgi:hypothetical protein
MSSKPSHDGVAFLRERAAAFRENDDKLHRLIAQRDQLNRDIELLTNERSAAFKDMHQQLTKMDCASNGNTGWEHRVAWMLGELVTQAEQYGRGHL